MPENDDIERLEKRRRTFGLVTIIFGIPNLILALATALSGVGITILLGILVYAALSGDGGDNPLGEACLVLLAVIFIALLIVAIILTAVTIVFAFAVGGQTLGGFFAFKGINYWRSILLIFFGTGAALIAAFTLIFAGVLGDISSELRIVFIAVGSFELLSFMATLISGIMVTTTKSTFIRKEDRLDGIKKRVRRGKKT